MRLRLVAGIGLVAFVAAVGSAAAQPNPPMRGLDQNLQFFTTQPSLVPPGVVADLNRVYLQCEVMEQVRAVIRNAGTAAKPDGPPLYLMYTTNTGQTVTEFLTERGIPAGQYLAPGIPPSSACWAWYESPAVNAPL